MLSPEIISRAQFGFTIAFHIIFPTINIGLAAFLVIVESLWLRTQKPMYYQCCRFWTKIFALTFGMGVVSGLVMSYELGTNFSGFTQAVGNVLGPLFTYEILSAFFLEAGFLGIMLFGWKKVSPRLHFSATLLVAVGTTISAFWIMSANSWMQTPAGYAINAKGIYVTDWWQVVWNPSFIPRFLHMMLASYVTTAILIAAVAAWYIFKNRSLGFARFLLKFSLTTVVLLLPLQIAIGDWVGVTVYEHQPIKTAAIEANWHTQNGAPLILLAWPDQAKQQNSFVVSIPKLASLINTHAFEGKLIGLDSVPRTEQPVVSSVFYNFRIMVGCGLLMLTVAAAGLYSTRRQRMPSRPVLFALMCSMPLGFIATLAGWMTSETGRQPWVVYGLLRTFDAVSPITTSQVMISLTVLLITYGVIFSCYLYYVLKVIKQGPDNSNVQISHIAMATRSV